MSVAGHERSGMPLVRRISIARLTPEDWKAGLSQTFGVRHGSKRRKRPTPRGALKS